MDAQPSMIREIEEVSHKDWVAIILSVGLSTAFNVLMLTILWGVIRGTSGEALALSENATQILNGAFSGIIGVLGAYLGFKAGARQRQAHLQRTTESGEQTVITTGDATGAFPIDSLSTGHFDEGK